MYFRILIGCGFIFTIFFGSFYLLLDIDLLVVQCLIAFGCFLLVLACYRLGLPVILLFRITIFIIFATFFHHVWHTGGIYSPSLTVFTVLPILGFFYRPKIDRFFLIGIALICMISFWPLTKMGYVSNLIPEGSGAINTMVVSLYLFMIIMAFATTFWYVIRLKNKRILKSMKELERTMDKLVQSEKMASLGILSAGIAHEINNPLNFITGGISEIQLELSKYEERKEVDEAFHLVNEGVKRVSTIVKSLNHFSREDEEVLTKCDLHDLLDNCLVMLNHHLHNGIKIKKIYNATGIHISANEGKLHQVFLNILKNAIQSISAEGEIIISTILHAPGIIRLVIKDTGKGIPEKYLKRITDPFFTTKEPGEGTGLGLYISYNILKEHDATLNFRSKPDEGTEVVIDFAVTE